MKPGEIWDALFPYTGSTGRKRRPVLVLTQAQGSIPEFVVAYLTGSGLPQLLPTDLVLDPSLPQHQTTGLSKVSTLRVHKLATLHGFDFKSFRGVVDTQTWSEVESRLRLVFSL